MVWSYQQCSVQWPNFIHQIISKVTDSVLGVWRNCIEFNPS